jgi:D-glycero-alpha-D-manno-heptose-7-phosphate kinase
MIIVRTPLRVSFFGGGTDHPGWFKTLGPGAVLSTSIDKYVYMTLRKLPPIFDFKYRLGWRILEQVGTIDEIQHPVVREVLRNYGHDADQGLELVYHADLPARSGLGSSSAFTVAALHALFCLQGRETCKEELAQEAIKVEQVFLNEPVGSQDQTAVAFGGLNRIDFKPDGGLVVDPIDVSPRRQAELESHLLMVFTNFTRDAGTIEQKKVENFANKSVQLNKMYEMVGKGQAILEDRSTPIGDFGRLLHEAWVSKKQLAAGVSNGPIDLAYEAALEAGALGGKLLGAGGGGFLLFFAPPEKHADVIAAVQAIEMQPGKHPVHVPFAFEKHGTSVILADEQPTRVVTPFYPRQHGDRAKLALV